VTINGRTAVHAGSQGTLTTVDVCWTKVGKPVVPIPYTNVARSADAAKAAGTVFINGNPVCHQKSIFANSAGDEPGTRKGVVSGTIKGKAEFVTGSPNVLIEGIPAVRQGDLMVSNNGNTSPMPLSQPGAPRAKEVKTEQVAGLDETELPNEVPLTVSGGKLHMQQDLVGYGINVSSVSGQTLEQQQKSEPQEKASSPEPGKAKPSPTKYNLAFQVVTRAGKIPIQGISISVNGTAYGKTNTEGKLVSATFIDDGSIDVKAEYKNESEKLKTETFNLQISGINAQDCVYTAGKGKNTIAKVLDVLGDGTPALTGDKDFIDPYDLARVDSNCKCTI
jgi:uncharacterized Zn-binding protein involved in type VI secretion